MLDSFDVAVVMILVNGSPGNFKSKAEELIKRVRLVKPNLLILDVPFILGYTPYRNTFKGHADFARQVNYITSEMTSVKSEVASVKSDAIYVSSELKEMKLLLHQIVSVRVALRMVVSLESGQVRQFLVNQ